MRDPGSHLVRPGRSRPGSGRSLRQLVALNHLGVQGCLQPSTSQRELLTSLPSAVLTASTAAALSSFSGQSPWRHPRPLCVSRLLCGPSGSPEGWNEVTSARCTTSHLGPLTAASWSPSLAVLGLSCSRQLE